MILGENMFVFSNLYKFSVKLCAGLVVYSDCRWNYVRV